MIFVRLFLGTAALFLTAGYGLAAWHPLTRLDFRSHDVLFCLGGFAIFIPLWFALLRKAAFFSTFEHELTHLIVGILFLKKPAGFSANDKGSGTTVLHGSNFIITLSPYFLPTFTLILCPAYFVIRPAYHPYYYSVLGFITSYHILSTVDELSLGQPDIRESGRIFSIVFLMFANLFIYGSLLSLLAGGIPEAWLFLKSGVINSKSLLFLAIEKAASLR